MKFEKDRRTGYGYGAIPKRPQAGLKMFSRSGDIQWSEQETAVTEESFGKVLNREIVDMDKRLTNLGIPEKTSTVKKLFRNEHSMLPRMEHRQDEDMNLMHAFGEDEQRLHTSQDTYIFDQECDLRLEPQEESSHGQRVFETETDSSERTDLYTFAGEDLKKIFYEGYKFAMEDLKKERKNSASKIGESEQCKQQKEERVPITNSRLIEMPKKERNSTDIRQDDNSKYDCFDRELALEEERLARRERLLEERKRRQRILEEKKEKLRRAEIDLIKKETWLKEQEDVIESNKLDPVDESICQQEDELQHRLEQIRVRENELNRKESLFQQGLKNIQKLKQSEKAHNKNGLSDTKELEKTQEISKEQPSVVEQPNTEKSCFRQEVPQASKEKSTAANATCTHNVLHEASFHKASMKF